MMMIHAGAGYAGHGTLCGTLGGSSVIINLVTFDDTDPGNSAYTQIIVTTNVDELNSDIFSRGQARRANEWMSWAKSTRSRI